MLDELPQLKNRDFEATYLENGTQCPAFDHLVNEPLFSDGRTRCDNCSLCRQQVIQAGSKESCGVMCKYRKDPPFEPLYKIGEEKWYLWTSFLPQKKKIRKVEWRPLYACWCYTFGREQHFFEESKVFNTRKECDEYILLNSVTRVLHDIEHHVERYGSLPGPLRELSLPVENKSLPPAEDRC